MAMWKVFLCVVFLAVVVSDEVSQEVPEKTISIKLDHSDLMQMIPEQKQKFQELAKKLADATPDQKVAILNDYTDDCTANLNKFIISQGFDPLEMPDIEEEFKWTIWPITYRGEMSLKNGWLQGAGTMKRTGDVLVKYSYPEVNIHAPMGFEKFTFTYDYRAKFMGLGPSGGVEGSVTGLKFTFDLNINFVNLRARVDKFKLNTLGTVKLKFTGGLLDWLVNIFVSVTIPMVKPVLRLVIQGFVTSLLGDITDVYNNVICTILGDCPEQLMQLL